MRRFIDPRITNNFLDSCAFDPKYTPEDEAANEIFRRFDSGEFTLMIAHSTQKEIAHPRTPAWVKAEAENQIYTITTQRTRGENDKLREIERILAGDGKVENIAEDAMHLFEAQKYGSYFITTDKRILNRSQKIWDACHVAVLIPSEFLSLVDDTAPDVKTDKP